MQQSDLEEDFLDIIKNNYLVVVEGKKDKMALNSLGVRNVITLKNRPLFEVVEKINEKDVVILTDLDAEGRRLFSKLRHHLQRSGVRIHNKVREDLFRTRIRCIECLADYFS